MADKSTEDSKAAGNAVAKKLAEGEAQLKSTRAELDAANTRIAELEKALATATEGLTDLGSKLSASEKARAEAEALVEEAALNIDALRKERDEVSADVERMTARLDEVAGRVQSGDARVQLTEAEHAALHERVTAEPVYRAKHHLAIAIAGVRFDLAPGDGFDAPDEALEGLVLGTHYDRIDE